MLSFERPGYLVAGIALFAVVLAISRFRRSVLSVSLSLGPPGGEPFSPPIGADLSVKLIRFAEFLGASCFVVALAGPVSVFTEAVYLDRGADIVFVIDASPSMSAMDMSGLSRFETARRLVSEFSRSRGADALGLVAVGREAALLVPPTVDHALFRARLDSLAIAELGDGTALGDGLAIAALHLRASPAARKAAVLLTDGENNSGDVHPSAAAAALRSIGVSLWVVGIGTSGEVAIDYIDPATGRRRTGLLDSRYDQNALRAVARSGGGSFFSAPTPAALVSAFSRIAEEEALPVATRSRTKVESLHAPLIWSGIALIALARWARRFFLGALL